MALTVASCRQTLHANALFNGAPLLQDVFELGDPSRADPELVRFRLHGELEDTDLLPQGVNELVLELQTLHQSFDLSGQFR